MISQEYISKFHEKAKKICPWFQIMEFNEGLNFGTPYVRPAHILKEIKGEIASNIAGKSVLEVGCNAGFYSMNLKKMGAGRVLAIDLHDTAIEQAILTREFYDVDVEIRQQDVVSFCIENKETFDYVIFFGLFYHLRPAVFVLDKLLDLTRDTMFFKTHRSDNLPSPPRVIDDCGDNKSILHPDKEAPRMFFMEGEWYGDSTNWWLVNHAAIYALIRSRHFDIREVEQEVFVVSRPVTNSTKKRNSAGSKRTSGMFVKF